MNVTTEYPRLTEIEVKVFQKLNANWPVHNRIHTSNVPMFVYSPSITVHLNAHTVYENNFISF